MEDPPLSIDKTIIDIGTKVQSLPTQGEIPQVFETIEKLEVMPKWNNLKPRLTKEQDILELLLNEKKEKEMPPSFFFKGISTRLRPGDGLLFVIDNRPIDFKIVTVVEVDSLLQRTRVNVLAAASPKLLNPQSVEVKNIRDGDRENHVLADTLSPSSSNSIQFSGSILSTILSRTWTEGDLRAYVIMQGWSINDLVKAINHYGAGEPKDEAVTVYTFRIKAKIFGHNAPLWSMLPSNMRYREVRRDENVIVQPAFPNNWDEIRVFSWEEIQTHESSNSKRLKEFLRKEFHVGEWMEKADFTKKKDEITGNEMIITTTTTTAGATTPTSPNSVSIKLDSKEPKNATKAILKIDQDDDVYAFIINVTNNTINLSTGSDVINTDSRGNKYENKYEPKLTQIYLDSNYQGLLQDQDSWIVLRSTDGDASAYKIINRNERTMVDFSLSANVTGLILDLPLDQSGDNLSKFKLRETTAYVQSEKLEFAEESILTPISQDKKITLDRMVDGLNIGQLIAISGELQDQPGVTKSELATISEIIHFEGKTTFTTIIFTKNLSYKYKRDTVVLNANVTRATHGETKQEIVGSVFQAQQQQQIQQGLQTHQQFILKQKPLTYISAPTSRGVKSTLNCM